ncbi:restriction endonuclease subunit S [Flavobacterium sp. 83]|uniref:restriction endonuclease subunit S n=1 Tax=Flavobacterium sp. 83 TaxID=1131812 RepID=UPI00068E898A|nr:restriction endonuclease subunit S [Flavobacterium sp. 83]
MSKVKPYSNYSDFKQKWLGELPSHWHVMRTKLLFDLITEPAPVGNSEELLSVYTALGVKPRKELEARGNKASSTDNYWRVKKGDVIVNKLLAWMGAIGISEYDGVTSPAYDILRPKENVNPYFYNFLFRNPIASREFKRHSRGIMDMRLRLYFTRFGDIKLPLPPIEEQDKIVKFLKFKLTKIDRFIGKKKKLIKLLNEQKAVTINQAVTKGLDSTVKMKPSGIEWLGNIPENWDIRKLKSIVSTKITDGPHETPQFVENGIPFLSAEAVNSDGTLSFENKRAYISKELHTLYSNKCKPQFDDVFIVKSGSTTGKIGYVSVKCDFNIWSPLALVRTKKELISGEYAFRSLQAEYFQSQVKTSWSFGTQPNIGMGVLENLFIVIPGSFNEQAEILQFINDEASIINTTISTIEKEIALTQEYRTALIAEAVTGKIDVRAFVIPTVSEQEELYDEIEEELDMVAEDAESYENE